MHSIDANVFEKVMAAKNIAIDFADAKWNQQNKNIKEAKEAIQSKSLSV